MQIITIIEDLFWFIFRFIYDVSYDCTWLDVVIVRYNAFNADLCHGFHRFTIKCMFSYIRMMAGWLSVWLYYERLIQSGPIAAWFCTYLIFSYAIDGRWRLEKYCCSSPRIAKACSVAFQWTITIYYEYGIVDYYRWSYVLIWLGL